MSRTLFTMFFYAATSCLAFAEEPLVMASHLAIYDLQLENAADKSGITGVSGRMAYEFSGSSCEGYTTHFRFVTRIGMEDGTNRLTDQQTTSFEAGDGKEFHFATRTKIDNDAPTETDGTAKIVKDQLIVTLKKPDDVEHKLKVAEFPTVQTEDIIKKARAGKHFYRTILYDGSDDADSTTDVSVVIGDKKTPIEDSETKVMGKLGTESYWPVIISYFNDKENQDGLPVYRTSFDLYENGITRDLVMDYGNFSIRGKMKSLQLTPTSSKSTDCKIDHNKAR